MRSAIGIPAISPYEMFSAADRHLVVAVGNDGQFAALARALGVEWLAHRRTFRLELARVAHREELASVIEGRLAPAAGGRMGGAARGRRRSRRARQRHRRSLRARPGQLGLSPIVQVGDRAAGDEVAQVADPMRLLASPVSYRRRPPRLGEHTDEVLRELGL